MARDTKVFKDVTNRLLSHLQGLTPGAELGSEATLAAALGASRTTVRSALSHMAQAGIIDWSGRDKRLARQPRRDDFFSLDETRPTAERIEEAFLHWILQGDVAPGTTLNEAELSRRYDVPAAAVREFLIRFEPFGLIEKRPNRHWVLKGFTRSFAQEMFDVREMYESHALDRLLALPAESPIRQALREIDAEHRALLKAEDAAMLSFPALDARFHRLLLSAACNRFIDNFGQTISIIVHYHYRWNKKDETLRNRKAAEEHLRILAALENGTAAEARDALAAHLATARDTLMRSVPWAGA